MGKKSFTANAIIVYSPEAELEILSSLARDGTKVDWKSAIILAAAYLEKFGIEKIKEYFESKEIKLSNKLQNFSLSQVMTLLYGLDLVKSRDWTQMNEIWRERNKIVHQERELPLYVGAEANKKYGKMIDNALRIIKSLKEIGMKKK